MSLRSAFMSWRNPLPPVSEPAAVARLLADLSAAPTGVAQKPAVDLNLVADRFVSDLKRSREPTPGDWNKITWCLWSTVPAIAENDKALDKILGRVAEMRRKRPYRQLASIYLSEFAPDLPRLDRISNVLSTFAVLAGDPWAQLSARYDLFNGIPPIVRIARQALEQRANVRQFLESIGLPNTFGEGGFADFMHGAGLASLQRSPQKVIREQFGAVRSWCLMSDDRLFFPRRSKEMARALTLPFEGQNPAKTDRDLITGFLVEHFGDPRTNQSKWIGLDDVADILKRWLTEQSLRQFFDVVDRIAPDGAWKYRRKFWLAFHNHGLIRNAWVVFGEDGAAEARKAFGQEALFARFDRSGRKQILEGHAVLLLDFGQCIVADWSYSGFCNIWPSNGVTRPPPLNQSRYSSDDVRRFVPSDRTEQNLTRHDIFGHGGSENYVWQDRVARRLYELTGVRVPQAEYTVR